jgi:mycothiol synthase
MAANYTLTETRSRNIPEPDKYPHQLEMVRGPAPVPGTRELPPGYRMRQLQVKDRGAYWRLFGNVFDTHSRLDNLATKSLPGGFFVVEAAKGGTVVASAAAAVYPRDRHPEGGSVQWVMTDDAHTDKGLGTAVVAAATKRLVEAGFQRSFLSTDDWRLPAIAVYLNLGWRPLLYLPEMEQRWRTVFSLLARPFSLERCVS